MHDLLTEILDVFRLQSTVYCQAEIRKIGWALQFTGLPSAGFHIVGEGCCWLTLNDDQAPTLRLEAGDLLVLPNGTPHKISDGVGSPLCANIRLDQDVPRSCLLMKWGEDALSTTLVCGMFGFSDHDGRSISALLPEVMHLSAAHLQEQGLKHTVDALVEEANAQRPGRQTILTRLADVLFVKVIRAWLADPDNQARGWLGALRDPQIAAALTCIHVDPAHDWTTARLAYEAAMSRSAFAARFSHLVGEAPFAYLTGWRMQVASRLLDNPNISTVEVAMRVGYESDTAFSKAFKRARGMTPLQFRRRMKNGHGF